MSPQTTINEKIFSVISRDFLLDPKRSPAAKSIDPRTSRGTMTLCGSILHKARVVEQSCGTMEPIFVSVAGCGQEVEEFLGPPGAP